MIKTSAKRKSQTHFEQVPVKVVKRKVLGGGAVKTDRVGTNNPVVEAAPTKTESYSLATRSIAKANIKPKAAGGLR